MIAASKPTAALLVRRHPTRKINPTDADPKKAVRPRPRKKGLRMGVFPTPMASMIGVGNVGWTAKNAHPFTHEVVRYIAKYIEVYK